VDIAKLRNLYARLGPRWEEISSSFSRRSPLQIRNRAVQSKIHRSPARNRRTTRRRRVPIMYVGSPYERTVGNVNPLPRVMFPRSLMRFLVRRLRWVLRLQIKSLLTKRGIQRKRKHRPTCRLDSMRAGRINSWSTGAYFEEFLLLARWAKEKYRATVGIGKTRSFPFSIYFNSAADLVGLAGLSGSSRYEWQFRIRRVNGNPICLVAAPLVRGHKFTFGSEQRCILFQSLKTRPCTTMKCLHLPLTEWFKGDWTCAFEVHTSPKAGICKHWPQTDEMMSQVTGPFRLDWQFADFHRPPGRMTGAGTISLSAPLVFLQGLGGMRGYRKAVDALCES